MKRVVMYVQADDEFVNMLAKIRSGQGAAFVKDLRERCSAPIDIDGIVATRVSTLSLLTFEDFLSIHAQATVSRSINHDAVQVWMLQRPDLRASCFQCIQL